MVYENDENIVIAGKAFVDLYTAGETENKWICKMCQSEEYPITQNTSKGYSNMIAHTSRCHGRLKPEFKNWKLKLAEGAFGEGKVQLQLRITGHFVKKTM